MALNHSATGMLLNLATARGASFGIPPFSGKDNEDVEALLTNFELFCNNAGKDAAYKARTIPFLLQGNAHAVYRNLSEVDKKNYQKIVDHLRLNFGTVQMPCDLSYPLLSELRMEKESSVQNYYEKFRKLAENLDVTPVMFQAFFVNGLDERIKDYVRIRQPKSITDAVTLAKQAELIKPKHDKDESDLLRSLLAKIDHKGTFWVRLSIKWPR